MRDHIRFHLAKQFVGTEDDGEAGVLSADGAEWLLPILGRVRGIELNPTLRQEDWGVVAFGT